MYSKEYAPVEQMFSLFTAAVVQMSSHKGKKDRNLNVAVRAVEQAARNKARLVVLPELCVTGSVFSSRDEAFSLAENFAGSQSVRIFSETARRLNLYLVASMAEREGEQLFNTAFLVGPDGMVGLYRKLHLCEDQELVFEPGNTGFPILSTTLGRIAIMIGCDARFPELYRLAALGGADALCCPMCQERVEEERNSTPPMSHVLMMAGAQANALHVMCASGYGEQDDATMAGQSILVGPRGLPLAVSKPENAETMLYADIDIRQTRRLRKYILGARRDDVYIVKTGLPIRD